MTTSSASNITTPEQYYVSGPTPFFASQADQRFSYAMYVPKPRPDGSKYRLAVIVHGTGRSASKYRDLMADFCEEHGVVALCPLFPAGIGDPDDLHNYKFIDYKGIRFDHLVFSMIEEAAQRVPIYTDKFMLHGFSGGGQFTQRMLLMYPERLIAASVGAAGRYTLLDNETDWWLGTKDLEERFGVKADAEKIKEVAVHLVVGENDVDTWETMDKNGSNWVDGLEKQGTTRRERIEYFKQNLAEHGIEAQLDTMPGTAHDGAKAIPYATDFFSSVLRSRKA